MYEKLQIDRYQSRMQYIDTKRGLSAHTERWYNQ